MKKIENSFAVTGFIGKDAEIRSFETASVARFSIAVSRADKAGEETSYVSAFMGIEAWRKNEALDYFERTGFDLKSNALDYSPLEKIIGELKEVKATMQTSNEGTEAVRQLLQTVREQTTKQLPAPELIAHAAEEKAKAEAPKAKNKRGRLPDCVPKTPFY